MRYLYPLVALTAAMLTVAWQPAARMPSGFTAASARAYADVAVRYFADRAS